MKDTLASYLKRCRAHMGITQQQLADKAGLTVGCIRHYEQGLRKNLPLSSAIKLASAIGCMPVWLDELSKS